MILKYISKKEVCALGVLLIPFGLMAAYMDAMTGRIPNWLVLITGLTAWAMGLYSKGISFFPESLVGFLIPLVGLFMLFLFRALGAGDIKFLAGLGLFYGLHIFEIIVISFLFGGVQALARIIRNRVVKEDVHTIHFACSMLCSLCLVELVKL